MHYACERGSDDALEALATAVRDLAGHRAPEVLRQLVAAQTLQWRLSPLHVALMHKHTSTVRKLLALNANPALRAVGVAVDGSGVSFNALHLAVRGSLAETVQVVLEAAPTLVDSHEWEWTQTDVEGLDLNDLTASRAVDHSKESTSDAHQGTASESVVNKDRRLQTALHMAIKQNDRAIILLLIERIPSSTHRCCI
jgi:ankyrin repeat protein